MDNNNGMFQVPSTTITTASLRMRPQRPSLATNYNAAFTLHATTLLQQLQQCNAAAKSSLIYRHGSLSSTQRQKLTTHGILWNVVNFPSRMGDEAKCLMIFWA